MTDDYGYDDDSGEESGDGEHDDVTTEAYLDEADAYREEQSRHQYSSKFIKEPSSDEELN